MARQLKLAFWLLLCAVSANAQTPIPSTPAGRVFSAWLEAFNSDDRARIDAFLKTFAAHVSHAELASAQFRGRSGGVTLLAITRSESYILGFRIQEKSQPVVFYGTIELSASKPAAIQNFALHAVPKGATLQDINLDTATRKQTIDSVISNLIQGYVYPEVAQKMADSLRAHESKGDYESLSEGDAFAARLTAHLQDVSHDKHLAVLYQPYTFSASAPRLSFSQWNDERKAMARDCGFRRLEILANNVGYLKLDFFADPTACGRTAEAATAFLANTDALIFDLRENTGGDPRMVALLSSYLFDRPVHLNDFYDRIDNRTIEYWTPRFVPGARLVRQPAYVLTSVRTFSGAEQFAYDLQNLKRVSVIGETTGGGSHAQSGRPAGEHFLVYVPHARTISPVTGTDWEQVGVAPDIRVRAEDALGTAERLAAEKIQLNTAPEVNTPGQVTSSATATAKSN